MSIVEIINKKSKGKELTKEEISFFVEGYVKGEIPDYQISALLMAIKLQNMTIEETSYLTEVMMNSGKVISWDFLNRLVVDKHSTGGIGDKVSITLCPLLASLGLTIAKMSGRGLGHTGGTLDKLESINGYNCFLSDKAFKENVEKHNIAIIGQTDNLVPADKKLYALRDVTGTVDSIPLIASSIMSKKLAAGSHCILLDVKCGNGAFMQNIEDAKKLGSLMISIGKELNRKVAVEITNMNEPLGKAIGNKLEVIEAIDALKNKGPKDFMDIIYFSASSLLQLAKKAKNDAEAKKLVDEALNSNKAYDKFLEWIKSQGGDITLFDNLNKWFNPKYKIEVKSSKEGYLQINNAIEFGICAMHLGAGREKKGDSIDFDAGIYLNKKSNDYVNKGDVIFTLYSSNPINKEIEERLLKSISFEKEKQNKQIVFAKLI